MKSSLFILFLLLCDISSAQKVIAKWGFDNSVNSTDSGTGTISTLGGVMFTSFVGGNPSTGKAFGTNTYPAQSQNNEKAGIQIRVSTIGFQDINLTYDQYNSNTSSKKSVIYISSDGTNFTKIDSLVITAGSTWFSKTVNLKVFSSLNNKTDIYIKLVSSFDGSQYSATGSSSTYGTTGTWRFDNIRITGKEVQMPSTKLKLSITSTKTSLSETISDTAKIEFSLSDTALVSLRNLLTFTGAGIDNNDFYWLDKDSLIIPVGSKTASVRLVIKNDLDVESLEKGEINIANLDTNVIIGNTLSINLLDDDMASTLISVVQGNSNTSALNNTIVSIEGVVTSDLQGTNEQGGYYIQSITPDTNSSTSEGIFVKDIKYSITEGDYLKVTGKVLEEFGQTLISDVSSVTTISKNNTILPVNISFPLDSINFLERFEGMKVKINQQLTVTENYQLGRYGEITASAGGRLFNPSNTIDLNDDPKQGNSYSGKSNLAALLAQQSLNDRSKIIICDKLSIQNPNPIPFIDTISKTLRSGSSIDTLIGVLGYGFSRYRIYPTVGHPKLNYAQRPAMPVITGSNVKIASMNVLNYFNGDGNGSGFPTPRGAATLIELGRQRAKIIAAIKALDADIIGLMEMENDGDGNLSAINDLVNGLNTAYGRLEYDYVRDPSGTNGNPGTDAIKVAMIYKPAIVNLVGSAKCHNDTSFSLLGRPPLAQSFSLKSNSEKFTVIVNHFKSKSCAGSPADPLDLDQLDGQGCFNSTRKKQSAALLSFMSKIRTEQNDSDIVIIGDFNAYAQEDPIDLFRSAGLMDLTSDTYSYVFDSQAGSLDHGFATASMHKLLVKAAKWHINCDEPLIIDYSLKFKTQDLYDNSAYRSSDHDPLISGFNFVKNNVQVKGYLKENSLKIYPNPNNGSFSIELDENGNSEIRIYELSGKLVFQKASSNAIVDIETNLPKGVYYLIVDKLNDSVVKKLVIN